jgi:hypothetical protein
MEPRSRDTQRRQAQTDHQFGSRFRRLREADHVEFLELKASADIKLAPA